MLKGLYPYARLQNWPQIAMATGKISAAEKPKISRVEVYWHTVRYRTVVLSPSYLLPRYSQPSTSRFPRWPPA